MMYLQPVKLNPDPYIYTHNPTEAKYDSIREPIRNVAQMFIGSHFVVLNAATHTLIS